MAEEKREVEVSAPVAPQYDLNAKWDYCMDLGLRRVFYSTLTGAFGGLILFRSPVSRWASVALGAGIGIGSAYSDCSHKFEGSQPNLVPNLSQSHLSKGVEE